MNYFYDNEESYQLILNWSFNELTAQKYILKSDSLTTIKDTPFSYVASLETNKGKVFLKATPKMISEPKIIKVLSSYFGICVPKLISEEQELNVFLMENAGVSLRDHFKNKFNTSIVCEAIKLFNQKQISASCHLNQLIDVGVPDWRLSNLPKLFKKFICEQKSLLIQDGLSFDEYSDLEDLQSTVDKLSKKLSEYQINETIVQPDFNDNNIVFDKNKNVITLIDLGEITISHPFFSHLNMLHQLKKHHRLHESDTDYKMIFDSCFKDYQQVEDETSLLEAVDIARRLSFVYGALAYNRLIQVCGAKKIIDYQPQKLASTLKDLLKAFM